MLREFISFHRSDLIQRCRSRVATRRAPRPTPGELEHGIPMFIDQLVGMLPRADAREVSGGGDSMDRSAGLHGEELLRHGFTIDQVVHDYGDLCQSITELAVETGDTISVPEFAVLNMRLDNAIASAVTKWTHGREADLQDAHVSDTNQTLGVLAHEMRNRLNTAILAVAAIKAGGVGTSGATAGALDRSLIGMRDLIDRALTQVRLNVDDSAIGTKSLVEMSRFMLEIQVAAALEASSMGCELTVIPTRAGIFVEADRPILTAAVANLLQNAFKFTRKGGNVTLAARSRDGLVSIDVQDECGGLPEGMHEIIFKPFEQVRRDPRGVGLGLAISRKGVEASGGQLHVRNMPGKGCVFTIDLPRAEAVLN